MGNNYRHINNKILFSKTIGYRVLSFILQTLLLTICSLFGLTIIGTSIILTLQKTITYFLYDYGFAKKFKVSNDEGFVLWATGPSGVGKSTLLDAIAKELKKYDRRIERLDGDIVRQSLTNDLGFSKKDRETNIKRVTFVSKLLSKNGVGVLASLFLLIEQ